MGYSDAPATVYVDVLGPLYIYLGQYCIASTFAKCRMFRLRVCPGI